VCKLEYIFYIFFFLELNFNGFVKWGLHVS